jgi:hypothetical protein
MDDVEGSRILLVEWYLNIFLFLLNIKSKNKFFNSRHTSIDNSIKMLKIKISLKTNI